MKQAAAFILLVALTFAAISGHAELPSVSDSVFGIYENDVYRNPYLGFGFRYEGWNFLTDAERERNKEINNRIRPLYSLEEDGGSGWRIVMSASLPGYTDAISVSCIHLGEHAAAFESLDEEELMDMMLDITKESIIASGYTLRSFEVADVSVSGWELPCYLAECSFSSMMYTSHFFTVQTYFVSEEYLVFLSSFADDLSTAKEALQHLFWL